MMNTPPNDPKKTRRELLRALSFFSQVGISMVACILVGVLLGRFLDNLFGTSPWLLLICSFLGAGASLKVVFDLGMKK